MTVRQMQDNSSTHSNILLTKTNALVRIHSRQETDIATDVARMGAIVIVATLDELEPEAGNWYPLALTCAYMIYVKTLQAINISKDQY